MTSVDTGTSVAAGQRRITIQKIQKAVADSVGISVEKLLERSRRQAIARPRQIAIYLATTLTKASLPDIGTRFGGYDHTTVIYSRDRIKALMGIDPELKATINSLERTIRQGA